MKPEALLRQQIARYLQVQYPGLIYRFDLAADIKLTMGQATRHKYLHPKRGYPDLFIAKTATVFGERYSGLFIELKAEGRSPYKKDGSLKKGDHIKEQSKMLEKLKEAGYYACFATGFEETKGIIDLYMGV